MKRKNEKVPEFDEIIFENRNKTYGAYNLRKQYNSVTSISLLSAVAFSVILVLSLSFSTEKGSASPGETPGIIVMTNAVSPTLVAPPPVKPPAELAKSIANLRPEVTDDTSEVTAILPSTEEILGKLQNGNVSDTMPVGITVDNDPVIPPETKPFVVVEESPEFPGGIPALMKYVSANIVYPEEARNNNVQGRVILKFVVNSDGSVDRIEILSGIDQLLNDEAIRVVKTLPRFKPGRQAGVAVPVWFTLPVLFKIENN
jgi:periplasmic protein TonB